MVSGQWSVVNGQRSMVGGEGAAAVGGVQAKKAQSE